jgi:hypothetical protein
MDIYDDEIMLMWRTLAKHQVRYIMIGGFAVNYHGFSRTTGDLDLWIEDTIENRKRLGAAFEEVFSGDFSSFETMQFIPGWTSFRFDSGFEIDIMTEVKGLGQENFNECFELAPVTEVMSVPVRFLHYNHLMRAKQAAGRPRDLWDIEELKKRNPDKES